MAYSGAQFGSNVDNFTQRRLYARVVDQIMDAPTYGSRLISQGKEFMGKTEDITMDVVQDNQGQFFTGLETLNASAAQTTIVGSYSRTFFTQPKVSIMTESFANAGEFGVIPLDAFKYKKAASQVLQQYGSVVYGTGSGNQPLGLGAIVDDGTSVDTIGGQSRTTYTMLKATVTSFGGALTLAKMDTLHDTVSAAGLESEEPNVGLAGKTVWSYYGQLLSPTQRQTYNEAGYDRVPVRSMKASRGNAVLQGGGGFTSVSYRGIPILKDDFATTQKLWLLNESCYDWRGATRVDGPWDQILEKVDLGTSKAKNTYEGTGAEALDMPSEYNGFWYQKDMALPTQAGLIARFFVVGQVVPTSFRRSGVGTGITGI